MNTPVSVFDFYVAFLFIGLVIAFPSDAHNISMAMIGYSVVVLTAQITTRVKQIWAQP